MTKITPFANVNSLAAAEVEMPDEAMCTREVPVTPPTIPTAPAPKKAQIIKPINAVILHEGVKVDSPSLTQRVSIWPAAKDRIVRTVFIQHQVSGVAGALGRKPERVQGGNRTCDADGFAKRAVFVAGSDVAGCGTD
jgi:hypothetical protein